MEIQPISWLKFETKASEPEDSYSTLILRKLEAHDIWGKRQDQSVPKTSL